MPPAQPIKLEELLERLGSEEVSIDLKHRHALRRALLNSPYFESHRTSKKWSQLFSYATTALAGGMAVTIVVVSLQIVFAFSPNQSSVQLVETVPAGPTLAATPEETRPDVEVTENPLRTLELSEIPRVVPVNVMNFVNTDLDLATTR